MSRIRGVWPGAAVLAMALLSPSTLFPAELETTIDLSYTYEQTHLGDDIRGETQVQQSYSVEYTSALTTLFDFTLKAGIDLENNEGDDIETSSNVTTSLSLAIDGPRASLQASFDGSRDLTEATEDAAETEDFSTDYQIQLEVQPEYWPEMRLKLDRKRDFTRQQTETVERSLALNLVKEIGELKLEFDIDYTISEDTLPESDDSTELTWTGKASYQSTLWWDVEVDLTYEVKESFSEEFFKGKFISEDKEYIHNLQVGLKKSLTFTPRLQGSVSYEYTFEEDLLLLDFDYEIKQEVTFDLEWEISRWLDAEMKATRNFTILYEKPPEESDQDLEDSIEVGFQARPLDWLQFAGKAEWEFRKSVIDGTGATLDKDDTHRYELSAKHSWGRWWDLKVTASNEYEYTNEWLTGKEATFKAELSLTFLDDIDIQPSYEIERRVDYEFNEPLELEQTRNEEFSLAAKYTKEFGDLLSFSLENDFSITREETIDSVLNYEEVIELNEDTTVSLELTDFVRGMQLSGEITRTATDTKDDEEPMLVDISYGLKWQWKVRDLSLSASYKYDDKGDSFDASTLNTKVAWKRDNVDVSGEYQFDKTFADEIDEERKLNLKLSVAF